MPSLRPWMLLAFASFLLACARPLRADETASATSTNAPAADAPRTKPRFDLRPSRIFIPRSDPFSGPAPATVYRPLPRKKHKAADNNEEDEPAEKTGEKSDLREKPDKTDPEEKQSKAKEFVSDQKLEQANTDDTSHRARTNTVSSALPRVTLGESKPQFSERLSSGDDLPSFLRQAIQDQQRHERLRSNQRSLESSGFSGSRTPLPITQAFQPAASSRPPVEIPQPKRTDPAPLPPPPSAAPAASQPDAFARSQPVVLPVPRRKF